MARLRTKERMAVMAKLPNDYRFLQLSIVTQEYLDSIKQENARMDEWLNNLAPIMVNDHELIDQLHAEVGELHSLITAWADAHRSVGINISGTTDECDAYDAAVDALRKAVGR